MAASVSFRDPAGSVLCSEDRIVRGVAPARISDFTEFLDSPTAQRLTSAGRLVGTRKLPDSIVDPQLESLRRALGSSFASEAHLFEHDRVWFPSYPYEWAPEMLYEAAVLTLDLAEAALDEGYGLKDATPFNVLFNGPNPLFVDLLSFERRKADDPTWLPYAQFLRMFVLPLLAYRRFGWQPHEVLSLRPHGLEPEELYASCSWLQRLRPPFLGAVSIPTWLGRRNSVRSSVPVSRSADRGEGFSEAGNPDKARFILKIQFRRLRRLLRRVEPASSIRTSIWSGYTANMCYSSSEFENKRAIVRRWLGTSDAKSVLDIGCNTGSFSEVAARLGAAVVALDYDSQVVGTVWKLALREGLNILPLVLNLAHPTPATGWRNAENPSFIERATGRFDTVMMLAVLHHLLVTERIPLAGILDLAATLTRKDLIIEYVDRESPMFQQLLRGRGHLFAGFTKEFFEKTCQQRFTILEKQPVKANLRTLYLLRKK